MKKPAPKWLIPLIAAAVIVVDQVSKTAMLNVLEDRVDKLLFIQFHIVFNKGTAFGLGEHFLPFLLVIGAVAFILVVKSMGSLNTRVAVWSIGLVAGGAISNLLDRLVRGHGGSVVDFIDLRWWPTFNLADTCIVVGMVLFIIEALHRPAAQRD